MSKIKLIALVNLFLLFILLVSTLGLGVFLLTVDYQSLMTSPQLSVSRKLGFTELPSHGLKTATWHVLNGNIVEGIKTNPLVIVVIPLCVHAIYKMTISFISNLSVILEERLKSS